MQKRFKWALALFIPLLTVLLLLGVFSPFGRALASAEPQGRINLLAAGLDLADEHTDVLMLLSLDQQKRVIKILQIPRDTYFSAETAQEKINQLYPHYRRAGKSKTDALSAVAADLSAVLGVRIDHVISVDLSTMAELLDAMGGVSLEVPMPIRQQIPGTRDYIELSAGYQTLSGAEAVAFLRHRAGYAEGDLGRIDAHRLLLGALYRKVKDELSLPIIRDLLRKGYGKIETDIPLHEQLRLAASCYAAKNEYSLLYATLPGEATRAEEGAGLSYYVINQKAAAALLAEHFGAGVFDPDGRLVDRDRAHFLNIYYDKNRSYSIVTEGENGDFSVTTKAK